MVSQTDRNLARFHLDLAHELFTQREALGLTVEELSLAAGISPERLIMIEEGDTSSLTDLARLCHALRFELQINADFGFRFVPVRETVVR